MLVRQDQSSNLPPSELKKHMEKLGDQLFTGACTLSPKHYKTKDNKNKVNPIALKTKFSFSDDTKISLLLFSNQ